MVKVFMTTLEHSEKSTLSRYDLAWDRWLTQAYAINWEIAIYALIFLVAVFSRFYNLGERVMSHDESLHTYYSWKLYDAGDFQHTPLMHGPVLFHAIAFFYFLFGDNDFTARIYAAVLGIAIVLFPYLFRRWLGKTGAILASIGLLISPMFLYYSRYIREDIPNIFYMLVVVYAMLQYLDGERPRRPIWMWVFSGAMLLMLGSKEVAFMYIAIFGTFLTLYWLLRLIQEARYHPLPEDSLPSVGIFMVVLGGILPGGVLYAALRGYLRPLAHAMVIATAGLLGYFWSDLLRLWQYSEMHWLWVGIGVGLVVFVRLIPLLWDALRQALGSNHSQDIMNVVLLVSAVLGTVLFLWGAFVYMDNDNQLDALESGNVFISSDSTLTPEDLRDDRQTGAIAGVVGVLMMGFSLGGMALAGAAAQAGDEHAVPSPLSSTWFINTALAMAVVALILAILKILADQEFEVTTLVKLAVMALLLIALESVGVIRTLIAGESRPGVAQMFVNGFSHPKSMGMVIIAGTLLGGALAVYAFGVLDIIKPEQIWVEITTPVVPTLESGDPNATAPVDPTAQPTETITTVTLDARLGNGLLLWLGLPILAAVLLVILIAIIKTPTAMPLPWSDILGVLLAALIVATTLIYAERRSLKVEESEQSQGPVAIDPTDETPTEQGARHDHLLIIAALLVILTLTLLVAGTRLFLPDAWDYFNRQPAFDVLIMLGTLTLPWLSAFPVFYANYQLDAAPLPADTLEASFPILLAMIGLSAAIGLSWNWRVWLVGFVVFMGLFMFFFTTVFTNGQGVFTGMVGSLGYWLEQQDVRRGSQPQYYYTLIQLPVYEFMPAILAGLAGIAGLVKVFDWRNESLQAEAGDALRAEIGEASEPTRPMDMEAVIESQRPLEDLRGDPDTELIDPYRLTPKPAWVRPYDQHEEILMQRYDREWLGRFPFIQFVGYWGLIILTALTMAGEKMPWLTTHISLPLILLGGWYAGGIIEKIDWAAIRKGGWALLLFLVPVFIVALLRVVSPLMGGDQPFQSKQQANLGTTNAWIAAVIVLMGVGYFIYRVGRSIGLAQTRRLSFAAIILLLAGLTARAAVMAAFQNYDYPTEYLVYAHSGPAVKLTMSEIDYLADRTNEGLGFKVAYDDDSSWPMTWYMRHYKSTFFAGEAADLEANPGVLEGARVVVVGNRKNDTVERILGDDYYRFDYKRLWWPMQAYFNLTFDRVSNVFQSDDPDAELYRQGLWDIWWNRDYTQYGIAQCVEAKVFECDNDPNQNACYQRLINSCQGDERYALNQWPVSDAMYVYVDKEIAAEIWDAGIGGETVAAREPQNAVDLVYRDLAPLTTFGKDVMLNAPRGVAVGADGRVYVADTNNSRIMVFDQTGAFLLTFGVPNSSTVAGAGTLNQPWGLAVDAQNRVYVADTWNHRIQIFSGDGFYITGWGVYGAATDSTNTLAFYGPRDVAIDLDGNVLVADTGNKRVRVYTPNGVWIKDIGSAGAGVGQLDEPSGLAVNPISGEIYVADTWNRRIQVFNADGGAVRSWEVPMWFDNRTSPDRPYLSVSPDGTLIAVSDMNASGRNDGPRVVIYDLSGNPVLALNAPEVDFAAGLHGVRIVAGVEFAPDGTLYVVDAQTGQVVKFDKLPVTSSIVPSPREGAGGADVEQNPLSTEEAAED
jgi:uncharacterized protein (TIGR03663 family)